MARATSAKEDRQPQRPVPLEIIAQYAPTHNKDHAGWWQDLGLLFSRFLDFGKYDVHEQYQYLLFLYHTLVPSLGPYPNQWKSVITMTGLPIEYSLNFQQGTRPLIRIGFEPVSDQSGSPVDPFNQFPVSELVNVLARLRLPGFDSALFHHFAHDFTVSAQETARLGDIGPIRTQGAFGFDLKGSGEISTKGYSFMRLKHMATRTPISELILKSAKKLQPHMDCMEALSILDEYMASTGGYTEFTFLAWDYVPVGSSRLKIYGVHPEATLARAQEMWTVGNRFNDPTTRTGWDLLRRLWTLMKINEHVVAMPENFDDGADASAHGNVPPLIWNYEIQPGSARPVPKLYFPVHGVNDLTVARGLSEFFASLGWKDQAETYVDGLARL
nr:prenyltransferase [Aspergillus sp.]